MDLYGFESKNVSFPGQKYGLYFDNPFGGGGTKGYRSPYLDKYETAASEGILRRAGAKMLPQQQPQGSGPSYTSYGTKAPSGTTFKSGDKSPGYQSPDYQSWVDAQYGRTNQPRDSTNYTYGSKGGKGGEYGYDFSGVGQQLGGAGGLAAAKEGYDFSPLNEAISGFRKPALFKQTYSPYQFNFSSLPEQYANTQYQLGAKDVRREAAGALQQAQEAIGTRRPGLLLKAADTSQRRAAETLAGLNAQIRTQMMQDQVEAQRAQQMAQADQAYRAYQSGADLESRQAEENMRYLQSLLGAGAQKVGLESGLLENERAYGDRGLQMLMDLYRTGTGLEQQSAQMAQQQRQGTLGFLGQLGGMAATAFCLPEGTQIETESGTVSVEDVSPGDYVRGGRVVAITRKNRPEGHSFYLHKFKNGNEVVMSEGHPYFDELESKEAVDHKSPVTCDILTDSGHYYVNGVKLGSTIDGGK